MHAAAEALQDQALKVGIVTGGVIAGVVTYRRMTQMHLGHSSDPFVAAMPMPNLETLVFTVGFTLGLMLIGSCVLIRSLAIASAPSQSVEASAREQRRASLHEKALQARMLASSGVLVVVGLALGVGCQVAVDEAQVAGYTAENPQHVSTVER